MKKVAKEKMKKRHKRISRVRKQRRIRFVIALFVLGLVVTVAVKLYYSGIFNVKKVQVTGNQHLEARTVVDLARVTSETNLLRLPAEKIRKRILKQRWVKEARIIRHFPNTLEIKIVEREPIVAIMFKDSYVLVDKDQIVVEYLSLDREPNLPKIRELRIKKPSLGKKISSKAFLNALKCLDNLDPDLKKSLTYVLAPSVNLLTLVTKDDVEVLYGEATQVEKKNQVIKEVFKKRGKNIIFIDVRVVSNPVVRSL